MITFSPAPHSTEWPTRFPTPFDRGAVHPLARRAAMELVDTLQSHHAKAWRLHDPGNGKMFGVLVVAAPDGTIGYLRGFSGMNCLPNFWAMYSRISVLATSDIKVESVRM